MVGDQSVLTQHKFAVTGALLLGVTVLLDAARRFRSKRKPGELIPSLPGGWPIMGHFSTLMRYCRQNTNLALGRWAVDVAQHQGFGIYLATLAGHDLVWVNDADLAEEIMQGDPHRYTKDFSALPLGGDLLGISFGAGLFFAPTDDLKWEIPHRILKNPFSVRGIRAIMPMMRDQADKLVAALKRDVGHGGVTHIDAWVTKMAFETIAVCGLGTSFGCFEDDQTHPFIKALNQTISAIDPLGAWPSMLRPIFCRELLKNFKASSKSVRDTCCDVIRKRRAAGAAGLGESRKDLLDMMLNDVDSKTGQSMTEDMIVDNVLTFLFAGQDSTAAAMGSCLCFLCSFPECKERLIKEIDEVVGTNQLEWDHLGKLQYLDWCLKETLRLAPPAPGIVRQSTEEQLIGGKWRMPAQMPVVINIMALHYSKELWGEDAAEFRPERWEHGQTHKFAYLPFATGPRQCIGREFTLVEQKVTMVKLFQNFDLRPADTSKAEEGYILLEHKNAAHPPFLNVDTQVKKDSGFLGLFRPFQLLERRHDLAQ
ncbi:ascE [Symbiodinium necroappetens]|uniref:AscE protein n=1 Tax=Symbiodinium necroappetens TaxID=1628268 RepID=A0A812WAH0_9DINO|nr:ascE [Symbiodinium necroappetens]